MKPTIIALFLLLAVAGRCEATSNPPANLSLGLVAEQTLGSIEEYRVIASVVRNRLAKGMNNGLVALKRADLAEFVAKERRYIQNKYGYNPVSVAQQAIDEVFGEGKSYAFGATHYEHTQKYPAPWWSRDKEVVKVLYAGTKKEITLWRRKR